jgi:hypothetical protein
MADKLNIDSPVQIQNASKQSVAFDLMKKIASEEKHVESGNRKYWLTLYSQCLKATNGSKLEFILKEE